MPSVGMCHSLTGGRREQALRIQRQIYSASGAWAKPRSAAPGEPTSALEAGCDHQEIAATLGQLGALERARGSSAAAKRYFAQQREMILRLARGAGRTPWPAGGGVTVMQVWGHKSNTVRSPQIWFIGSRLAEHA